MRGKDAAGKDLPAGEDVCMNYLIVHKPIDGVGGIAWKPGHEFEDQSNCGAWSDATKSLQHEVDGKIGGQTRAAYGRCNTGAQTTCYCEKGCARCKRVDYPLWRSARTMAHEFGHSHSSRHDYATERPSLKARQQCRPDSRNNAFIMDYPPRVQNTRWNTQTGVYKFSPCSQGDISMFIWDRRASGVIFQGDLGKCKGKDCGGVCSGQYCDFSTGLCRKYTDDKPYATYTYNMDGWPCDTVDAKGAVTTLAYCVKNKCVKKPGQDGNNPIDYATLFVTVVGDRVDPWAPGLYTRTRRRSYAPWAV